MMWCWWCLWYSYLHSQAHGVQHDEEEHQVLKVAGSDNVPHLILVGVFRNVAPEGAGLKSILHTLTLQRHNTHTHTFLSEQVD